jgi:multiple sugar transport system permease protein
MKTQNRDKSKRHPVAIQNRKFFPWLLMAPTLLILMAIGLFPFGYSLYLAGTNIILSKPYLESTFVGLEQYQSIVQDSDFFHSLWVTGVFTISAVSIEFWAGLGLALLFRRRLAGKSIYRLAILVPMVVPPVVVGLIWQYMLFPHSGLLSYYSGEVATFLGIEAPTFLSSPGSALATLVLVDVWQWTPFMFLILHAGLASIPNEPYEAAEIDGASPWRIFWTITMPLLKSSILIALVIRTMDAFRTYDTIAVLTGGGPGNSTETLNIMLTNQGFKFFDASRAAALSLIMFVIILALSSIFVRVFSKTKRIGAEA